MCGLCTVGTCGDSVLVFQLPEPLLSFKLYPNLMHLAKVGYRHNYWAHYVRSAVFYVLHVYSIESESVKNDFMSMHVL